MEEDSGLGAAIAALVAGIIVIGSAIGLFLLLAGGPGADESDSRAASEQRQDDEALLPSGQQSRERQPVLDFGDDLVAGSKASVRCFEPDDCVQPSTELIRRYNDDTSCDWYAPRICIVPLGNVPVDLIEHLTEYYKAEYDLDVRVLRPIRLDEGLDDGRPGQVTADLLREYFFTDYFFYDQDSEAILIGLTAIDIYTPERPEWRWFFGGTFRFAGDENPRQSIISIYRMDPVNWSEPEDVELRNRRVRTLMNKYVALSYYGLQLNDDPESVLYRLIGGLADLDRIDERIPLDE